MEFDLHIHSKYSFDSISEPQKILKIAMKKGLNGVAITDHDTIKGGIKASKTATKDFFVIIGTEIGTESGDILGLFLNEEIKSRSALEVIDEIKEQGGIAVLPHPYKRTDKIKEEIIRKIDAIEGFNARGEQPDSFFRNKMAKKLASSRGIPMTAGSDAHFYFEIGRGRCSIDAVSDIEDIRKAILRGKTKITGEISPLYVEPMSQIIRMFKTRNLKLFFPIVHRIYLVSSFYLKTLL